MKQFLFILSFIVISVPFILQGQNALSFDGGNDIVQTTYGGVLGNNDRTFEAWINLSASASGSNCIMDYGLNAAGSRNTFMVNGNNQLAFIAGGTNTNFSSSVNAVPSGVWTHVAMVMDNGTGYMYVNGVQMGTGSLTGVSTPAGNVNLRIGQRVTGGSIPFQGEIDELRVWSVARTAAEIQATMNTEFCVIPATLEAYYQFNHGTANGINTAVTTLDDISGNTNDGTLTGFALSGTSSNWVSGVSLTSHITNAGISTASGCVPYITLGNQTLTATGIYEDTVVMQSGCDSIYTLGFSALSSSSSNLTVSECGSYTSPSGTIFNSTGIYMDTIANTAGCDSVISIDLTINNNVQSNLSVTTCVTYTAPSGKIYTSSGVYKDTIPSQIICDSIITIILTVNNSTSSSITLTECETYTSPTGNIYTTSGIYNDTLQNSQMCDSIIEINLTILNTTFINQNETACDSYVSPSGETWTSTGTYQDTIFGTGACDTVYKIDLVVHPSVNTSLTETACRSFTSNLDNTYTTSGIFTELTKTKFGCDSTITLDLTIESVDTTVAQNGFTLSANENGVSYQWYNCADQTIISGETAQTYTPSVSGSYYVEIESGVCTLNSACYEVMNVGIDALGNNVLALYPNPSSGIINIDLDAQYSNVLVRVLNSTGKLVNAIEFNNTLDVQFELGQANGLYTIQVYSDNDLSIFKVLKLN